MARFPWGWPYNDGQMSGTETGPSQPVPSAKTNTWSFKVPFQLERLRVYTAAPSPGVFQTLNQGHTTSESWTAQGQGWWEANLSGIQADHLTFESPVPITLDEGGSLGQSVIRHPSGYGNLVAAGSSSLSHCRRQFGDRMDGRSFDSTFDWWLSSAPVGKPILDAAERHEYGTRAGGKDDGNGSPRSSPMERAVIPVLARINRSGDP